MKRPLQIMLAGISRAALGAVFAAAVAGCAQSAKQIEASNRMHHQIKVAEVTAELKIDAVVSGERLGVSERDAVKYFAAAYQDEGHGAVIISRPSNGPDDVSAIRASADARAILLSEGVEASRITEGPYDASGARSAPLVISYQTWEAFVPGCPDLSSIDMVWTGTNSALPSFGCAVATNLAAMIADPADLVGAQRLDPSDIARRSIVLSKYRNGEPTTSSRSDAGSGSISDALN